MHKNSNMRELVLIGGGHSHALVLASFAQQPPENTRVTVINPGPIAAYSGMLPGFVAGHYARAALEIDVQRLAAHAGAQFVDGRATAIDRAAKEIHVTGHAPLRYDIAALDIGITTDMPDLPGFAAHGVAAKPLGGFARRWAEYLKSCHENATPARMAVIGSGVAGAELALAMSYAVRNLPGSTLHLIDRSEPLKELRAPTRRALLNALSQAGVQLHTQCAVAHVTHDRLTLDTGTEVRSDFTLGAAGARPYGWLADTGLDLQSGYVRVTPTLQSSDRAIFASGDCADLSFAPRPKAGVYAVRAAPILAHNFQIALSGDGSGGGGSEMRDFSPQKDYLKLVTLGGKRAIADRSGLRAKGAWVWQWKNWIDQKFMRGLTKLS